MTVVCWVCKKEVSDYLFNKDLMPVCTECSGHKKVMQELVEIKIQDFKRVFTDEDQVSLENWTK